MFSSSSTIKKQKLAKKRGVFRSRTAFFSLPKKILKIILPVLVVFAMYQVLFKSSYFQLQEVEVTGSFLHMSQEEAKELSDAPYGKNIFAISLSEIAENLKRFGWVKSARIRRVFPHSLSIHVEEFEAESVLVLSNGKKYFVSPDGVVFKKLSPREEQELQFKKLPLIYGFEEEVLKKFSSFSSRKIKEMAALAKTFQKVDTKFVVKEVHYSPVYGIELKVVSEIYGEKLITVYLGKESGTEVLSRWAQFSSHWGVNDGFFEKIYLHVPGKVFAKK